MEKEREVNRAEGGFQTRMELPPFIRFTLVE
jgi:hypothetical protein